MKPILNDIGDKLELYYDDGVLCSEYWIEDHGATGDYFEIMYKPQTNLKIKLATFYHKENATRYIALIACGHDRIQKESDKYNQIYIEMCKIIRQATSSLADNLCADLYKKTRD